MTASLRPALAHYLTIGGPQKLLQPFGYPRVLSELLLSASVLDKRVQQVTFANIPQDADAFKEFRFFTNQCVACHTLDLSDTSYVDDAFLENITRIYRQSSWAGPRNIMVSGNPKITAAGIAALTQIEGLERVEARECVSLPLQPPGLLPFSLKIR